MREAKTQAVIDTLTRLGFTQRMANGSHALYAHPAGACVSVHYASSGISGAHLKAIERQVTGFGVATADAFNAGVYAS